MKNLLASVMVIGLGIILLVHYGLMWIHGTVYICESNRVVLGFETAMGVAILVFGLERWISEGEKLRKSGKPHKGRII
jgi:glucokinase